MNQTHNPRLRGHAKQLRKNMTKEERRLWYGFLKGLPVMVHRQKVIGDYIVDFYIAEVKIVIELDGSQHYEPEGKRMDEARDNYLHSVGITVLRYSNADVNLRFSSVCEDVWNRLQDSEKKPSP
ncbi:MAG: endonuclease domain-containing protein [Oscillospiraceae bacterium]|nr:endonuclease domain-containing protein [Oscillospiraceae bacterium]